MPQSKKFTEPTSLGLMGRVPVAGRCKTRLGKVLGDTFAASLYSAMLRDALVAFEAHNWQRRVFFVVPEENAVASMESILRETLGPSARAWEVIAQQGQGLTERLCHVFETLSGVGPVIVSGTDCPMLPTGELVEGLQDLSDDGALLGPAEDGGYYCVAMRNWQARVFEDISWSGPEVFKQTMARFDELSMPVKLLAKTYDVDRAEDVERLKRELAGNTRRAPHVAKFFAQHY